MARAATNTCYRAPTPSTRGGAWVGAAAFTLGLLVETILVAGARAGVDGSYHPVVAEGGAAGATDDRLLRFSTPLVANMLLWWSTPLIINSVLARSPFPAEAIAAFVVVEAVAWFLAAPVGQFQHVSIALVDCKRSHRAVQSWSLVLAAAVALLVGLVSTPPVRRVVLGAIFALDAGLLSDIGAALRYRGAAGDNRARGCRRRARTVGTRRGHAWRACGGVRPRSRGALPRAGRVQAGDDRTAGVGPGAARGAGGRRGDMMTRSRPNQDVGHRIMTRVMPMIVGLAVVSCGDPGPGGRRLVR